MSGLSALDWSALVVAALLVGFAKTAIGGVAAISVALFAAVLPARASTGALLPLLLVGDVVAVRAYRRHADWSALLRLLPSVAVGVLAGAAFVARIDETVMRRTIGAVLLALVAVHLWQRRPGRAPAGRAASRPSTPDRRASASWRSRSLSDEPASVGRYLRRLLRAPAGTPSSHASSRHGHAVTVLFGVLAGFTTMVANSGGAVMSLYLLSAGLSMLGFLGTTAWFFLVVNAFKVPFSVALGLITGPSLLLGAVLAPAVLAGAVVGRRTITRLDQARFEQVVLACTVLASVNLLR